MKLLLCLVVVGLSAAHVRAQDDNGDDHTPHPVGDEESWQNDDQFLKDIDEMLKKRADEAEEEKSQGGDDNVDNNGGSRNRRSIVSLLSPVSSYRVRGSDVYYRSLAPSRRVSYGYYYDTPAFSTVPAYYTAEGLRGGGWSFVKFFKSFRPLQAFRTADNTYVRNYIRIGSFDECLSDFRRLRLTEVRAISTTSGVVDDYGLVAASSGFAGVAREITVGYVGLMRDFPYKVLAIRSGCQLDGFPGFHDCIVFRGATYPYARSERRFIYINQQALALASYHFGGDSYSRFRGLGARLRGVLSGLSRDWSE